MPTSSSRPAKSPQRAPRTPAVVASAREKPTAARKEGGVSAALHILRLGAAAIVLSLALAFSPAVYQELHHHHDPIDPGDVKDWIENLDWKSVLQPPPPPEPASWLPTSDWFSSAAPEPEPVRVPKPMSIRFFKAAAMTVYTLGVIASKPEAETNLGPLLLPVPLGFLALDGKVWLALRLVAIWLPIWIAASLYPHMAFHMMAASLSLVACSLAGGFRTTASHPCLAASWVLAVAACCLLMDAWVEALSRLFLFETADARSHLLFSVMPETCFALIAIKIYMLHSRWDYDAAHELRRSDTLTSSYTLSMRRVARMFLKLPLLSSYPRRLQLLGLLMAFRAVRTYFVPVLSAADVQWRLALRAGPALVFLAFSHVVNDWDRCWGGGPLNEQHSWSRRTSTSELEFTCVVVDDDDDVKPKSAPQSGSAKASKSANRVGHPTGSATAHRAEHDRTDVYAQIASMLSPRAAAFDVRVFIMLYGDAGRGLRTHAHAEAVIEIRESGGASSAEPPLVVKVGYFLDKFSVKVLRGKAVTDAWPQPGYAEPNYTGRNVLLSGGWGLGSMGFYGWSRDLVEESIRRTVNLASHRFARGYAKIPQPGEYNCFVLSLNVLVIWLGAASPLWWLGSPRAMICLGCTKGVGVEAWAASMLMMLLQLPQPLNYAFGHLFLSLDRGLKTRALGSTLVAVVESVSFVGTLLWLLSKLFGTNNFGLIASATFALVTPVSMPFSIR